MRNSNSWRTLLVSGLAFWYASVKTLSHDPRSVCLPPVLMIQQDIWFQKVAVAQNVFFFAQGRFELLWRALTVLQIDLVASV